MMKDQSKTQKISRVFIFEPCLGKMTGHWESNCRRFTNELTQQGIEVKVFCQQNPDPKIVKGLDVIPVFTHYSFADTNDPADFKREVTGFASDYSKIDKSIFKEGDLLLFTTVMPQSHKATMEWLDGLISPKGPKAAFIFMIGAGDFKDDYLQKKLLLRMSRFKLLRKFVMKRLFEWKDSLYKRQYKTYISNFHDKNEKAGYYYFGGCEEYTMNFNLIFGVQVRTLPFPTVINPPKDETHSTRKQDKNEIRIGYFGHASLEKGAQFLEHIVKKTLKAHPNVKFDLHINPNIHTQDILKKFNEPITNVTCYHGHRSHEELTNLIQNVDINLLPYAPAKYAGLPSMVFTEAVCAASILVIPQHTWLSRTAETIKAGYIAFEPYDQESIAKALIKAINMYPKLKRKTLHARKRFLAENNVSNYINKILQATQSQ